ncbi:hypothetical protein HPB51_007030 [Rhipicephalus microplus]|uniref:Uncharacterized protein n=1 Tax=Rhipicephalus microplus TaxID=6941 RepID=A0A9J6E069_RHIMP|nr:hypothetical protein HPB51_007030 [Rhipicephalus microplus]
MAKGLHRKKKRLAKRRRSVSKHRKSHREHSQSEDDVKCSSKHSSSSNAPKGQKTRSRSRNMKEKQAALTEEGREGPLGRRAADDTANVTRERESKCKSLSETCQAHWLPQELVGNSSTALDSGYQDRIEGAARLEEDAPAIRDSDQQTPNVRDKCATSSSAGISDDCLNGKPSFQEQMPQSSKSKEACLPPTQLPQRDGDRRQDGLKPVHVHGLENAAESRVLPPESTESTSEVANARHHRLTKLSHALLSNSMRDLGTSFLQSNPLLSLMKRASRSTLTQSMAESRQSHSSKPPEDEGHADVRVKSKWCSITIYSVLRI